MGLGMGRIKSTLIKRTGKGLKEKLSDSITEDFAKNKKLLGNVLPSKKIRNKVAGHLVRLKKQEKKHKIHTQAIVVWDLNKNLSK